MTRAHRRDSTEDSRQRGVHGADRAAAAWASTSSASSAARSGVVEDGGDAGDAGRARRGERSDLQSEQTSSDRARCNAPRPGEAWIDELGGATTSASISAERPSPASRSAPVRSAGVCSTRPARRSRVARCESAVERLLCNPAIEKGDSTSTYEPAVYDRHARLALGAADSQRRARRGLQDARRSPIARRNGCIARSRSSTK